MDFPRGNLITAISTLSAVWLTQRVGAGQRREERSWQIKYDAYRAVIAAARGWDEDLRALISAKEQGGAEHRDLRTAASEGARNLADIYNANILPLSPEFLAAIQAYRKTMSAPNSLQGQELDRFVTDQSAHLRSHLEVIAIRELQLEMPSPGGRLRRKFFGSE